jgi:hypothetical protein
MILTMFFCGCSKESNNQQKEKIETAEQKTSDSNRTNTSGSASKKTVIKTVESHSPAVNVKEKASTRIVSEEVMPSKQTTESLTEKKESKNKLLHESNPTSPINSKLAEANQSKIKTIDPKVEISKSAKKSKYSLRDYYRLHRGLPRPPK